VACVFAATAPGRAIPEMLATDPSSVTEVSGLVVLSPVLIFVSLKRGGLPDVATRTAATAKAAAARVRDPREVQERRRKTGIK
jgi:hypothetical protein